MAKFRGRGLESNRPSSLLPVILLRHDVRSLIQSPCGPPFRPYARPRRLCGVRRRHARARQRPRGRRVGDCVRQAPQACDRQLLRHVDHGRLLQPHDRGREGEAHSDRDRREDLRSRQLSEGGRKGKLRHVDRLERPHGRAAACGRRLGRGARPQLRQRRGDHRARRPSRTQDARGPARQERRHHEPHRLRGLADSRLRDGPQGARPRGLLLRDPRLGLSDDAHRAGGEVGRGGRGLRGDVPARAHGPRRADRPEGLPRDRRARRQARRLPPLDRALSELVLLDQALGPHVRRPNAHRHAARRAGRTRRHAVDDLERQPTPLRGVPRPAGALRQSRRLRALREAHPALGRGRGRRAPHPAPQHASSCAPGLTPRTRAREGHGRKASRRARRPAERRPDREPDARERRGPSFEHGRARTQAAPHRHRQLCRQPAKTPEPRRSSTRDAARLHHRDRGLGDACRRHHRPRAQLRTGAHTLACRRRPIGPRQDCRRPLAPPLCAPRPLHARPRTGPHR